MRPPTRALARRVAGWLPAVVVVPVVAVLGVRWATPDDDVAALRAEFPLDLGTTWVYDVLDHGRPSGTRTSQVIGPASVISPGVVTPAVKVTRHYTDYPGTGPRSFTSYLGVKGAVMYQYAQEENDLYQPIDPPAIAYRLPVRAGVHWSYNGTVGGTDFRFDNRLERVGDVTVGGHTFTGCAFFTEHIPFQLSDGSDALDVYEEQTCPGYGTVRSRDRIAALDQDVTEELVEFHGVAGNWYADGHRPSPDGRPPTGPLLSGSTAAFDVGRTNDVPDGTLTHRLAWTDLRREQGLFPPVSAGDAMVLAERSGQVSARSTTTGEIRWRVRLRGPVLAPPTVAGSVVLVGDSLRNVWALSTADGRALWVRPLPDVISSAPTVIGDRVAVPADDGSVTMFDLLDGRSEWSVRLGGAARTPPAYDGRHLLVGDQSGTLTALDPSDGGTAWSASFDDGVAEGPLVLGGDVLVQDGRGVVRALTGDGAVDWESRGRGQPSDAMAAGEGIVVTIDGDAEVTGLDADTGARRWTVRVPPTDSNPVVVGDEVVLTTRDGRVERLSAADGERTGGWALPSPVAGRGFFDDVSPGLVGDDLVVTAYLQDDVVDTVLYAYPVRSGGADATGTSGTEGVVPHLTGTTTPGTPNEPAAVAGPDVVMAVDHDLDVVAPDGSSRTILSSDGLQTGAVVADGIVVARHDGSVEAHRLSDGRRLWSAPGGDPALGSVPTVSGSTVVFGVAGTGLEAVDLTTGARRWSVPLPAQTPVLAPVGLPGSDVLYAGGGLARYDGRTGRRRWQDPAVQPFGPPAYADGIVYALSFPTGSDPAGLGAYDADTGHRLWFHPVAGVPSYVGPVVGEGVVVAADSAGTVTAWSARAGLRRWSLPLGRGVAGSPVISHGHVLLAEAGVGADLVDPSYRVSIHALATGAFESAWEPTSAPFAAGALVGGTPEGDLLVPVIGLVELSVP